MFSFEQKCLSAREREAAFRGRVWTHNAENRQGRTSAIKERSQQHTKQSNSAAGKKRLWWGPVGSLEAVVNAATAPSSLSSSVISARNAEVDKQLCDSNLCSIDVVGDGNCFFRSISMSLYGHERDHMKLRIATTDVLAEQLGGNSESVSSRVQRHIEDVRRSGTWVSEDVIVAAAACLRRAIHVYLAAGKFSPRIYNSPAGSSLLPILLAFYEPGHYRAVLKEPITCGHNHLNH